MSQAKSLLATIAKVINSQMPPNQLAMLEQHLVPNGLIRGSRNCTHFFFSPLNIIKLFALST